MGKGINIAFVGDIMPGGAFVRTGGVDQAVIDHLSSFDLRIGTLESAFGDGSILCHKKNTPELGTIIFSPDESVKMLVDMGINAVSLANNHSCDCDLEGLYHTMDLLDKHGIAHFGAGHDEEEASAPTVLKCKGKTICLLGYLQEYQYFYRGEGYHPTSQVGGINIYDKNKVIADVKKYKAVYDYVFVLPHWGTEGSVYPQMQEVKEARSIIGAGADGVIASHAHIVQPTIKYRKKVIAMNLGNFAFPDRYIVKPRISYYPTDEELKGKEIPTVNSFKAVNTLSYKIVSRAERKGVILGLTLRGKSAKVNHCFTELSEANVVEKRKTRPVKEKLSRFCLGCLIKEKTGLLYRIHKKLLNSTLEVMSYDIKMKFANIAFRLWKWVSPSVSERYQHFDTQMFLSNEMCPSFDWKKYVSKKNSYFKKWGFNVSQLDAEYYSRVSGIKADHYVTRSMAVHYIYPYLDRYDFVPAYMDKNMQKRILGLPDPGLGVLMPEEVVYNANGFLYDGQGRELTREMAIDTLLNYGKDTILKPSVETFGGHGVMKVSGQSSRQDYEALFDKYRYDFTFQKIVEQHPLMAQFNPSSVNTVRVVTYRDFKGLRKVLYACMRFGSQGSVMDNVCSGGGYTGVNVETGRLTDRKRYSYYVMDVPELADEVPNEIHCWDKIKAAALALHGRIPQLGVVGWDFSLTPDEVPMLIEFNPRPGVGLQQAVGPMFSREELDEIMKHVSKVTAAYHPLSVVRFNDFPDRYTVHLKFGNA